MPVRTLCQQKRIQSMISLVVYRGQWFPKCDTQGLFMPEQCDNTGIERLYLFIVFICFGCLTAKLFNSLAAKTTKTSQQNTLIINSIKN